MRIIAGNHGSRKIKYPRSNHIKPTADNVREAVFNLLGSINNFDVLDLFAGSGSYGLEALSRGAKFVYFNDLDRNAVKIIKENVTSLNEDKNVLISNFSYERAIKNYLNNNQKFDLIFVDPPYYDNYYEKVIPIILPIVKNDGKIVIEVDKRLNLDNILSNLNIEKNRTYGSKRIIIINVN